MILQFSEAVTFESKEDEEKARGWLKKLNEAVEKALDDSWEDIKERLLNGIMECTYCHGTGEVDCEHERDDGLVIDYVAPCPVCTKE